MATEAVEFSLGEGESSFQLLVPPPPPPTEYEAPAALYIVPEMTTSPLNVTTPRVDPPLDPIAPEMNNHVSDPVGK